MSRRVHVLSALILALCGARLALHLSRPRGDEVGQVLLRFEPAQVAVIELQRGVDRLRLERRGEGWVVASHGGIPARAGQPDALLSRLRGWRVERVAGADPAKHAEWKVDPERARQVRLRGAGGELLAEVWAGRVTGIARDLLREQGYRVDTRQLGLFARVREGEALAARTVVVNDFVTQELEPNPRSWFLRPLVRGERERAERLSLRRPGGRTLTLALRPQPRLEGDPRPVDGPRAYGALSALFALEALGPAAGAPPDGALQIALEVAGQEPQAWRLWAAGERWFLAGEGFAVEVAAGEARGLVERLRPEGLLRREVVRQVAAGIRRVHWTRGGVERSLIRRRAGYDLVTTGGGRGLTCTRRTRAEGLAFLEALTGLEVSGWIEDPAELRAALGEDPARLVVVGSGGREELELGPASGGRRALRQLGSELGAWVDAAGLERAHAALRTLE